MDAEWELSYNTIKDLHDEAYKTIDMAIRNEETENPQLALFNYKLGISLIDQALATPVALPEEPEELDETWHIACKIIHKMKRTRGEVLQRVGTLSQKYPSLPASDESSCEQPSTLPDGRPRTYSELAQTLRNIKFSDTLSNSDATNLLELIFSCEGAHLYNIATNGEVTTTIENSVLRIVRLAEDLQKSLQATYFLQIIIASEVTIIEKLEKDFQTVEPIAVTLHQKEYDNSWIYPLVPGASPCFLTDYGAFIFPDLQSEQHGTAVGIVVPIGSEAVILEILEAILHGVVKQIDQNGEEACARRVRRATSDIVSDNLMKGAFYISKSLVRGSEKVGEFVTYSTPYIISKLGPAPVNAPPVSECLVTSVEMAKSATGVAASMTGYLAGKVGSATMALGRYLAPHVQKQGTRLLSHTMGYSQEEATDKV